jgi:hypothetical protein
LCLAKGERDTGVGRRRGVEEKKRPIPRSPPVRVCGAGVGACVAITRYEISARGGVTGVSVCVYVCVLGRGGDPSVHAGQHCSFSNGWCPPAKPAAWASHCLPVAPNATLAGRATPPLQTCPRLRYSPNPAAAPRSSSRRSMARASTGALTHGSHRGFDSPATGH